MIPPFVMGVIASAVKTALTPPTPPSIFGGGLYGFGGLYTTSDESLSSVDTPTKYGAADAWICASSGEQFGAAIDKDGKLWTWGVGFPGDGTGNTRTILNMYNVMPTSTWKVVSVPKTWGTDLYTLAIRSDGTLWGWGNNNYGQLGQGDYTTQYTPVQIGVDTDWVDVVAGYNNTFALKSNGTLWACGINNEFQLGFDTGGVEVLTLTQIGIDTDWAYVTADSVNSAAIKTNGTLWSWGGNYSGQLAQGDTVSRSTPTQVGVRTDWKEVNCSGDFTMCLAKDGRLYGCGYNYNGEITGTIEAGDISSLVQIGTSTLWKKLVPGYAHIVGAKHDSTAWGWGHTYYGELATTIGAHGAQIQFSTPMQLSPFKNWRHLSTGNTTTFLESLGPKYMYVTGMVQDETTKNSSNVTTTSTKTYSTPVQLGAVVKWNNIQPSERGGLAIDTNKKLWSWGDFTGNPDLVEPYSANAMYNVNPSSNYIAAAVMTTPSSSSKFAIKEDGTLWSWGDGGYGQLGTGAFATTYTPVQVGTATNWKDVSASWVFAGGIKTDGTLWVWGYNGGSNSLGLGAIGAVIISTPVQLGAASNWKKLACTADGTYALKTDGTLWAWGDNSSGHLGTGLPNSTISTPVQIGVATNWADIHGASHVTAIKTDGTLWGWGYNFAGQVGNGTTTTVTTPVQIGVATDWWKLSQHSGEGATGGALKTDGTLWAWGSKDYQQYPGLATSTPVQTDATVWREFSISPQGIFRISDNYVPIILNKWFSVGRVDPISPTNDISSLTQYGTSNTWKYATGGWDHFAAIDNSNKLWAWGSSPVASERYANSIINIMPSYTWKTVAANNLNATIAIASDSSMWAFGENFGGEIGNGDAPAEQYNGQYNTPIQIGTTSDWNTISLFTDFAIATKNDGTLWGWGRNQWGSLGLGNTTTPILTPVQISAVAEWKEIATGDYQTIAIKTDGTLWGWGYNGHYELGVGDLVHRSSPVQISAQTDWKYVTCGSSSSWAVKNDGSLWGWGQNANGCLGLGDTVNRTTPVLIDSTSVWTNIKGGAYHFIGTKDDGTVWVCGNNGYGQLGTGDTLSVSSPIQLGSADYTWNAIGVAYYGTFVNQLTVRS